MRWGKVWLAMKFAIFGSGGLGAFYGARLAAAGHEVGFVARGAQLEALKKKGLQVYSPMGDLKLEKLAASNDPAELGVADVVVVAVKTWQVPEAARAMRPLVGAHTMVVPFLNGVEAPDQLAAALGAGRVLGGLSKVFSLLQAPGVVRHMNPGAYVEFGELSASASARAENLRLAFEKAGVEAKVSGDIRTELWKKLVAVSSWAGLAALSRSPMGTLRKLRETRGLIDQAIDEGVAVAGARGHPFGAAFKDELWRFYDALPEGATASMQRDILAGKPSELDAWNGAVLRFGAAAGVATPVHRFTCAALAPLERRARGTL